MKTRWKLSLFLIMLVAVNAYAWSIHQVLEWREPDFPVECVSYPSLLETRDALLERGHTGMLADMASGERLDGSQYGYFRIDPPNIPEIWVCYYEWGAGAGYRPERPDDEPRFGSIWDIDVWDFDLELESYTEGICIWETPSGRHMTRAQGTKCPPRP